MGFVDIKMVIILANDTKKSDGINNLTMYCNIITRKYRQNKLITLALQLSRQSRRTLHFYRQTRPPNCEVSPSTIQT